MSLNIYKNKKANKPLAFFFSKFTTTHDTWNKNLPNFSQNPLCYQFSIYNQIMHQITQYSPAKINLFLHITGKRPDGYHNLQTVFRLIDLYDTLTFSVGEQLIGDNLPINLVNADTITDNPTDNLIVKASIALLDFAKKNQQLSESDIGNLPLIDIKLDKKIPMGAGLGGGSSNCATTLMTLNQIWQLNLNKTQLCQLGATLGADVPIFIFGQDAIAEGIGEILIPIDLPPQQFLLLKPDAHINTSQLFAHHDLKRNCQTLSIDTILTHTADFLDTRTPPFCNVFEPVVRALSPAVNEALFYLERLSKVTETTPRMTGSGSCVFLPIPIGIDKNLIDQWQHHAPCPAYLTNTLSSDIKAVWV